MGLYGGTTVKYTAPPPDNTFSKLLEAQLAREKILDDRAYQEKLDRDAKAEARKTSGASAYTGLKTTTKQQLAQGLIGYESAANQLRDYAARYELTPPEADISELTQEYTTALPGKRATGMSAAYEELLGRPATEEELSKGQKRFQEGYYGTMEDFKGSLTKSPEYQKKFNPSYLDNYYDTMFGKQTVDEKGDKTGQRTFRFDSKFLPTYSDKIAKSADITIPDLGGSFTGTPEELGEQQRNIRDARQYLYSAGLTNLQGEIDTNIQKLKKESAKEVATIGSTGNIYSNLVSGFWS